MRRLKRPAAVAAMILMISAGAVTGVDRPVDADALTLDEALWIDAGYYAIDYGVSQDEAHARLRLQDDLNVLIAAAEAAAPDAFAGGWIEHDPAYRAVLQFTGQAAPQVIEKLAAGLPVPVKIVTGLPRSLAALSALMERVDAPGMAKTFDIKSGTLLLEGPERPSAELVASIQDALNVPVEFKLGQAETDHHTYGGARLSINAVIQCTSGFTVRHAASATNGVATAAHCPNTMNYTEPLGVTYALAFKSDLNDDDQDVQWHDSTGGHVEWPQFWDGQYLRTVVADAARAGMVGDYVCHRGATTGTSCGTIESITHDPGSLCGPNRNGGCASTWVRVTGPNLACSGGDSGGPWFNGGTAYGIHKSGASSGTGQGQCSRASFMSINYIGGLGLTTLKG